MGSLRHWPALVVFVLAAGFAAAEPVSLFESSELLAFRFRVVRDGCAVFDRLSQLMWQRCSFGQDWSGASCTGRAQRLEWDKAARLNDAGCGFADWRLPERNELEGLLAEDSIPAIDPQVFPNTPPSGFWTLSASQVNPGQVWYVSFGKGVAHSTFADSRMHVRLVRQHRDGGLAASAAAAP